jgi:hypothetical protein
MAYLLLAQLSLPCVRRQGFWKIELLLVPSHSDYSLSHSRAHTPSTFHVYSIT